MTTNLTRGGNAPIGSSTISVSVAGAAQGSVDLLIFQLGSAHKVRTDADLIFFNQPRSPEGAVILTAADQVAVNLALIPEDIETLAVAVNLDEGVSGSLANIAGLAATVSGPADQISAAAEGMSTERSAVLVEIYRRNGQWKARNVSAGWNGGLADLVKAHGVVVEESAPAQQPVATPPPAAAPFSPPPAAAPFSPPPAAAPFSPPPAPSGPRSVPGEAALSLEKRQTLDLRKREVHQVLLTKQAVGIRARIVMVIDKSGSMMEQYNQKKIHRTVERMVPVATQVDDDGAIEAFLYATKFLALPDLRVEYMDQWINDFVQMRGRWGGTPGGGLFKRSTGGLDFGSIGYGNDESKVMQEIMNSVRRGNQLPTWVLFFTDGGITTEAAITKLVRKSAALPIFWQFVGTGGRGYGILERLDNLDGREIDNAGFFAVDDMDRVSDADLYNRLISEFPRWLARARQLGIVG